MHKSSINKESNLGSVAGTSVVHLAPNLMGSSRMKSSRGTEALGGDDKQVHFEGTMDHSTAMVSPAAYEMYDRNNQNLSPQMAYARQKVEGTPKVPLEVSYISGGVKLEKFKTPSKSHKLSPRRQQWYY